MKKFAFIGHPITLGHFYPLAGFWGGLAKRVSPYYLKEIMLKLPSYKYNTMRIKSLTGVECEGYGIILPILPEQVAFLGENKTLEKVLSAVRLAERLGAKLVSLGGFTSVVGNEGEYISSKVNIAVTSGNTFPAYLAIEGIKKACGIMEINMSNSTATVMGATGDIGSICTKILSKIVRRIYIVARNEKKIEEFARILREYGSAEIIIPENKEEAIRRADIILTATTAITSLIEPNNLKPGAIVCDVAVPANVTKEVVSIRKDVLVFEGGLCKLPYIENIKDIKFHKAMLGKNCIFGCLAEAMLLGLENRFESFSLGRGNITEQKVFEIGAMALKHGFEVSEFFCGYKVFTNEDLKDIKRMAGNQVKICMI